MALLMRYGRLWLFLKDTVVNDYAYMIRLFMVVLEKCNRSWLCLKHTTAHGCA